MSQPRSANAAEKASRITETAKLLAAQQIALALENFQRVAHPSAASDFAGIGVSDDFLSAHLPGQIVSDGELAAMVAGIRKAADSRDMAKVNQIVAVVGKVLGPLKTILGLGA